MTEPEETVGETVEMQLRERITVLEEWRARAEPALGLMIIAGLALAAALLGVLLTLRKRATQ